ncbi:MAG TPA: nuclear transport factor 2 family protein [Thermoanaerobaculia bacterium]|jgi:ketosteroid isomerase-like protein|nr:nuclear transport factor 2 family protein [Thermoanaerobaculia bacterium]
MKKILVFGLAAALAAGAVTAQTIDRQAALDSVVATENAFSKTAGEKGIRDSFVEFFADDSVLFRPDPVPGREFMRSRPQSTAFLSWYPVFADVSLAGDLGYTTGPWELRAKGKDDPNVAHGDFITLWQKQADGTWKVKLDHGVSHPPPASRIEPSIPPANPARIEKASLPKTDAGAELKRLEAADRAFAAAAEKGTSAAYLGVLTGQARLYREGLQPALNAEAIRAALAKDPAAMTWEPSGTVVAISGDLGSTYGIAKSHESGAESGWVKSHNYFRIWRKQQDGSWKVVLDVMTPRPKPVEKPVEKKPSGG